MNRNEPGKTRDASQLRRGPGSGRHGGLGQPVEKARDFKGTVRRLVQYMRPQKYQFTAVFILAVASTLFSIIGPKILGKATTKLGEGILARYSYYTQLEYAIKAKMPAEYINQLQHQPVPGFDFD
jgi:ATP-binding cassette subfamily B protein